MPNSTQPGFTRLFNPRGIAIIGASASGDPERPGAQSLQVLTQHGYAGGIYPINPKYGDIAGRKCYASVADVDGDCDVAIVALPAAQVTEAIAQCGRRGIGFAVVVGGGFREAGPEGVAREQRMVEAARAGGVRVIGPNCLGFVNIHDRIYCGFGSITRPPYLNAGPVSAVIQSGGFGNSMLIQASDAGVGFRHLVASGGEADITTPEVIRAYADDPETRVIFAYLEGLHDGRAFMDAARYALAAGKPLVVLKAGNTREGMRAAASHTASMTSSYDLYRAAFRQCGVIEARDMGDAADFLSCLVPGRLPRISGVKDGSSRGRNVAVTAGSGGSLVNFADAVDEFGLKLPTLAAETVAVLKANLPAIASMQNPVDYTTGFLNEGNARAVHDVFKSVADDPGVDQCAVFLLTSHGVALAGMARMIVDALAGSDKPVVVCSSVPAAMTVEGREIFRQAGWPVLSTPRRVAQGMAMLADHAAARARRESLLAPHSVAARALPNLPANAGALDEHASKRLLAQFGIAVTRDTLLTVGDAGKACLPGGMEFPVAVKIVSRDITHKTDIGAVRLNVADNAQLATAAAEVVANARSAAPAANLEGVLVSEMVTGGLEIIIGVVNDASFGPVVAFGLGGVLAETLRDTTYRIAPFGLEIAREMIGELRASALFVGVRGQPPRDVEALAQTLVRVSECAWLLCDRLAEMDINPVLVRPAGGGVVAADALVVLR
jgi:acyl-CoA synthetase (NDP forming)